jgi:hypothetical protein
MKIEDVVGAIGKSSPGQVLWFGGVPKLPNDDAIDFNAAVETGRIVVEGDRLGTIVAELRALGQLPELLPSESEEVGVVSLGDDRQLSTTPEERLHVEAVASIVDDSWTASLSPLGSDAEYATFRRFHGDLEGPRLLVEGVRRGFAIERSFEKELLREVKNALADHA